MSTLPKLEDINFIELNRMVNRYIHKCPELTWVNLLIAIEDYLKIKTRKTHNHTLALYHQLCDNLNHEVTDSHNFLLLTIINILKDLNPKLKEKREWATS